MEIEGFEEYLEGKVRKGTKNGYIRSLDSFMEFINGDSFEHGGSKTKGGFEELRKKEYWEHNEAKQIVSGYRKGLLEKFPFFKDKKSIKDFLTEEWKELHNSKDPLISGISKTDIGNLNAAIGHLIDFYNGENGEKDKKDKEEIKNLESKVKRNAPLNQILYGPPGTGKTYSSMEKAVEIIMQDEYLKIKGNREKIAEKYKEFVEKKQIIFTTFHQSYGYEDFIEGYKPSSNTEFKESGNSSEGQFVLEKGVFKQLCDTDKEIISEETGEIHQKKNYVIIIDEINRGNISKIFGELITLIEEDKRTGEENEIKVTLPYSKEIFGIPNNVYIIGTMNTADRSIALLDTALRRRFVFQEIMPEETLVDEVIEGRVNARAIFRVMNQRIEALLGRESQIGHSYFMVKSYDEFCDAVLNKVIPLLQEYFYFDIEKVKMVLDGGKKDPTKTLIRENSLDMKNLFGKSGTKKSYSILRKEEITEEILNQIAL